MVKNPINNIIHQLISDKNHYVEVLLRTAKGQSSLWIGTADIKDLYAEKGKERIPFFGVLADL